MPLADLNAILLRRRVALVASEDIFGAFPQLPHIPDSVSLESEITIAIGNVLELSSV